MRLRSALLATVLVSLPFTNALTIPLAFPLKVYELALIALAVTWLVDFAPAPRELVRLMAPVAALLVAALIGLLWREMYPPESFDPSTTDSRFGPLGDGFAKLAYLALAAVVALLSLGASAHHNADRYRRAWLVGAALAMGYAWYLVGASLLGIDVPHLPSVTPPQPYSLGDRTVLRSGTFEEGNFFGLYLVLSVAVALSARRTWLALLLSATVLLTFSTVSVLTLIVLWVGVLFVNVRQRRGIVRRVLALGTGVALVLAVSAPVLASPYGRAVVIGKLIGDEAGSRLDRWDMIVAGWRMFRDHPVIGVGLNQYAFNYRAYQSATHFQRYESQKIIPNNVYIEVLAEQGVIGFMLFGVLVAMLWRRSHGVLRAGVVALLVGLAAFPSFSVMFIWAYLALVAGDHRRAT